MRRVTTAALAAAFGLTLCLAGGAIAGATPAADIPQPWQYQAMDTLAADGLMPNYRDEDLRGSRPQTRRQVARLVAGVIRHLQQTGSSAASSADLDLLQRLMDSLPDELVLLGIRATNINDAIKGGTGASPAPAYIWHGSLPNQASLRSHSTIPSSGGGTVNSFINAFLTSPADNDPFEHNHYADRFRFDDEFSVTHAFNDNVALSIPIRLLNYDYRGDFSQTSSFTFQPAAVLNVNSFGRFSNVYVRAGLLDDLASSRLGLTYKAPDETQQGPGFQNPVQPYENGLEVGGNFNTMTRFQFAFSWVDQSLIDTMPGNDDFALDNYMLVVAPPRTSLIQHGGSAAAFGSQTDTFVANGGPMQSASLRMKAGLGTVYIASVNGTPCVPSGAGCPIAPSQWYYVDRTNQVVFSVPLPAGSTVQIAYSTGGAAGGQFPTDQYVLQRYHFNARINQEFKGLPGAELGFSASRLFDAGTLNSNGLQLGNGGVLSDTVWGFDGRLPLWFLRYGKGRAEEPVLFAEGAVSKYTPDLYFRPAITDSALLSGVRLKLARARATVQYQAVGPDFMSGAPIRWFGPGPSTFQFWHGGYFPGFMGFANNVAQNRAFDTAVTPGCTGTACTAQNSNLTYIYPIFNPFAASGPQFYSGYAPNTRGFTESLSVPFGSAIPVDAHFSTQHLTEMVPNGFGQLSYGPGFATPTRMNYNKNELGVHSDVRIAGDTTGLNLTWTVERLSRNDKTAYAYVPFNPLTGGADASSGAALNTYLAAGNLPVLFYPNYINMVHSTVSFGATIPAARNFNLGLGFDTQGFHGAYGTTLASNISQHKNDTSVSFAYMVPNTTSSIALQFANQRYTDDVLSAYNFNLTSNDVNLTIRF